jgi:hypothetical protein
VKSPKASQALQGRWILAHGPHRGLKAQKIPQALQGRRKVDLDIRSRLAIVPAGRLIFYCLRSPGAEPGANIHTPLRGYDMADLSASPRLGGENPSGFPLNSLPRVATSSDKISRISMSLIKFIAIVAVLAFSQVVLSQQPSELRKIVIPLQTTRADLEKMGRLVSVSGGEHIYDTQKGRLHVYWTGEKCERYGWNVPAGRVRSYWYLPSPAQASADVVARDKSFVVTNDDTMYYYIDPLQGVEYAVQFGTREIYSIGVLPNKADSDKRCKGFPPYSLVSEHTPTYQEGAIPDAAAWDAEYLFRTFYAVSSKADRKGFIFIYCKKGEDGQCRLLKRHLLRAARVYLENRVDRVKIVMGGYRDQLEVETFVIPLDYPDIVPRPYYAESKGI